MEKETNALIMNWGKWIIASFILFAVFIATLVTVCMRQDISLVSKDYYKDELAYQEQITRISNTQTLAEKPSISMVSNGLKISFRQPIDRGEVKIFCPSDPKMDRTIQLKLSGDEQLVDVHSLKRGMYRAKMFWSANSKDYFFEKIINIK
jgi:hypothetical protein